MTLAVKVSLLFLLIGSLGGLLSLSAETLIDGLFS
jgi:hypothetical protein